MTSTRLLTTCSLLAYYSPLTTYSSHCLLPTADCLLPTAYCLLPTAYCLLPTGLVAYLEVAHAQPVHEQEGEGVEHRDQAAGPQRQAEEQLEGDGRADHLV